MVIISFLKINHDSKIFLKMKALALFLTMYPNFAISMTFNNNLRGSNILQSLVNVTHHMLPSLTRVDIVQVGLDLIPHLGNHFLKLFPFKSSD